MAEDEHLVLRGPLVTLRPPRASDVDDRYANGRHAEIVHMYGGDPTNMQPMSKEAAEFWLGQLREHPHAWVIEHDGRAVGEVRLDAVNSDDRRASLAVGLQRPDLLGHGLGTEAVTLVLGYAFGVLGLHRVGLRVLAYNERAIACYRKCGFSLEGRERESAYVAGEWHDDVIMGILEQDSRREVPAV